jgi:uncharacterized protein YneR
MIVKKILLLIGIVSLSTLCFAEDKSDADDILDLSKITIKNDMGGIDATFEVKYAGITKKLAPGKSITIYNVNNENSVKACSTNKFNEFTCDLDLYYEGDKLSVSFEPETNKYTIGKIIDLDS